MNRKKNSKLSCVKNNLSGFVTQARDPVADPDLQIRGKGGGGGHPDPEIRGGGAVFRKNVFQPFGSQFGPKITGPGPPGPLPWIRL